MWVELFLCLLLAHIVADFFLQTKNSCARKKESKWYGPHPYFHGLVVFALSWLVSWEFRFWWCAWVIGITHFAIDMWKSYRDDKVEWFIVDQCMHIIVLATVAFLWCKVNEWNIPLGIEARTIAICDAILLCWKPANIFIKLMLKRYSVNMPEESKTGFNAGALIGNLERWLILAFVLMGRYEALGLLVAAKSIIRYSDQQVLKTEYVLAGTLMSIFIAVVAGLAVGFVK